MAEAEPQQVHARTGAEKLDVDASHNFKADGWEPADGEAGAGSRRPRPTARADRRKTDPDPERRRWDSLPESGKWLAHGHLAGADAKVDYRIDGWLAERGTSVWFGAGSTGKTQLMLWMAAMIASHPEDRREQTWLGGAIRGTGHVLILTAEDTREQIIGRLRDVVTHSMGQDEAARERTCARLHVMPFLSMSEDEFKLPNPSLLELDDTRVWSPSPVMLEIRRYVEEWNRLNRVPEDQIVGVVMDSATSMSGFDSLDAQATTNFFFYLGRLCENLRIFWAVIGHTPKTTSIPRNSARETAPSRLRGVAMWTTAPRLTVEVRLIQEWRVGRSVHREAPALRDWLGDRVSKENLLVVYVAKANLKGARKEERFLARMSRGAFIDVTDQPDEVLSSGALGACGEPGTIVGVGTTPRWGPPSSAGSPISTTRAPRLGRPRVDPADYARGTDLVLELIREGYAASGAEQRVSANRLRASLAARIGADPRTSFVTSASGGGKSAPRPGAINWHLDQLREKGVLHKHGRYFHLPAGTGPATTDPATPLGEVRPFGDA